MVGPKYAEYEADSQRSATVGATGGYFELRETPNDPPVKTTKGKKSPKKTAPSHVFFGKAGAEVSASQYAGQIDT